MSLKYRIALTIFILEGGIGFVSRKALEGAGAAKIKAVLTITY